MSAKPVLSRLKDNNTAHQNPSLPLIWKSRWGSFCLTIIIYFIVASVSLRILYKSDPTPIWPPAGFALVAALWFGSWGLGGIALGKFIFNISQGKFAPIELLLTVAVVLQAMVGAYLLKNLCTQYQADICISKALQKAVKRENGAGQKLLEEFEFIGEYR